MMADQDRALVQTLGLDVQLHASGPAHRHCIAAIRNTHFYEQALVGPDTPNAMPPVYKEHTPACC